MMREQGRVEREAFGELLEATLQSLQTELSALRDEVRELKIERDVL